MLGTKTLGKSALWAVGLLMGVAGCGLSGSGAPDAGCTGSSCSQTGECPLLANTTATGLVSANGCALLQRDTSSCQAARQAQGLTGYWLKFSCRVTLTKTAQSGPAMVQAVADGQPDYKSNYFVATDACHETYTGGLQNPNTLSAKSYTVLFPETSDMVQKPMMDAVVGLALNGVPIYGNFAAPGDDIFQEARTFDRCAAHPQMGGSYHYHSEPVSISSQDARFIGVMRDGYPIYGRMDAAGLPTNLDSSGGHLGTTEDSPTTPVYHYHVNEQTSTSGTTVGQKQWFLTKGSFRGTPATCTTCR